MWLTWLRRKFKTKFGQSNAVAQTRLSYAEKPLGDAKRILTLRKREFDKLRDLRQNQTIIDNRPKYRFFQTSMLTDLSEKTSTLKKIDDIEAQMSMQWWKTEVLEKSHGTKAS